MNKEQLIKSRYNDKFFDEVAFDYATPITAVRNIEETIGKEAGKHLWNCVYGYEKGGGKQGFIPLTDSAETALQAFNHIGKYEATYSGIEEYKQEEKDHNKAIIKMVEEADDVDYNFICKLTNYLRDNAIISGF